MQSLWEHFFWAIGGKEVDPAMPAWQLVLRTIVIYIVALLLIRIGKRRFMGSYTSFDILLGFVVGSVMSRAITGAVRFVDMILVVGVLVGLHWVIAVVSFYTDRIGSLIKNSPRELIVEGELQEDALRKSKIGRNDLMQALREEANVDSFDKVKTAYLERDGRITVIPKECDVHVVDVDVEEGVQKIRIQVRH